MRRRSLPALGSQMFSQFCQAIESIRTPMSPVRLRCPASAVRRGGRRFGWLKHSKPESPSQNLFDICKSCFVVLRRACHPVHATLDRRAVTYIGCDLDAARSSSASEDGGRMTDARLCSSGKSVRRSYLSRDQAPAVMRRSMDWDNNKSKSVVKLFLMRLFESCTRCGIRWIAPPRANFHAPFCARYAPISEFD